MRKPIDHELKCEFEYFELVANGEKKFELRIDDRDYQDGDTLILKQLTKDKTGLTGKVLDRYVLYVLRNAEHFGLMKGYCIMSLL